MRALRIAEDAAHLPQFLDRVVEPTPGHAARVVGEVFGVQHDRAERPVDPVRGKADVEAGGSESLLSRCAPHDSPPISARIFPAPTRRMPFYTIALAAPTSGSVDSLPGVK